MTRVIRKLTLRPSLSERRVAGIDEAGRGPLAGPVVAAAVIGPRLQRDREVDAPNNLLMVAAGAGLLWLGWNGFNGGDSYYAGANASAAVLNTNLCTAVAMLLMFYLVRHAGASRASVITYINPVVAALLGVWVLDEHLGIGGFIAFALILLGSWLATRGSIARSSSEATVSV